MQKQNKTQIALDDLQRRANALIFISHDSRDAKIAEAFSRLISSVSAGVLKSFRTSDKSGNQGIEYGIEWYPEIMKKLEMASDVVCLLTPNSVNRPWILFEAGVAKGKLDKPVHGIALGIPLEVASLGPFAQLQNVDDEVDSLTQFVIQLLGRIPEAEPDRDVVKMQVEAFKQKIAPLLEAQKQPLKEKEKQDEMTRPDISGDWEAEVDYDWTNATYTEIFSFKVEDSEVLGTASFLGTKRGVLDGKLDGNKLTFHSITRTRSGDQSFDSVHHYRGRASGDEIKFIMQTVGDASDHIPVEFTAKKMSKGSQKTFGENPI
jgi:hypothetical protein